MGKILFIAGFPPPASGQLIMQKKMYDLLREEDKELISLDFSTHSKDFSKTSLKKIMKLIIIVFQITKEGLLGQGRIEKVYYSLSGPKRSALIKDILIGIPLNFFFKKKLILQVHAGGYNQNFVESNILFMCLQQLYKNTQHLFCLTEYQKKELEFLKAKTKSIVYNFCEDVVKATSKTDLLSTSNNGKTLLRLLSVGHLNANKGIVECVILASQLKSRNIDFNWKLIGSFQDRAFEVKIQEMIAAFDLTHNIAIENEVSNDLILAEYANADFLIFLSNGPEGQPVVLIEALMVAKAVIIAKDISGIGEYVKSGSNGFLVKDYTEVIPLLSNYNRSELDAIRLNARKSYLDHFSVKSFSQNMSKIFEKSFGEN